MATTYVYLNGEDLVKLISGQKIEIQMTDRLRSSDRLFVLLDEEQHRQFENSYEKFREMFMDPIRESVLDGVKEFTKKE